MKLTRSGRPVTKPAKFSDDLSEDSGISSTTFEILSPSAKNTFIVRLPNKSGDGSVFGSNGLDVKSELLTADQVEYINGGEGIDDPMPVDQSDFTDNNYSQTIIYEGANGSEIQNGGDHLGNNPDDNLTEFSLTNIPIDMVDNSCKNEEILGGGSNVFHDDQRMTLAEQLALIQSGAQIHLQRDQNGRQLNTISLDPSSEIRDHVISIEENGQITIEQINNEKDYEEHSDNETPEDPVFIEVTENSSKSPHTPPPFPEWWLRLSSTFLSFLSTGYMVDLWLVCCDGEAVPAHQLIFSHVSSNLRLWLAEARVETQEEAVTLSLPDWDSDTVGQFVSALYQGQLPAQRKSQDKISELADIFGIDFDKRNGTIDTILQSKSSVNLKQDKDDNQLVLFSTNTEQRNSPSKSFSFNELNTGTSDERGDMMDQVQLGDQQVQVVQTDSGEILLVTCDGQGESLGLHTQAQFDNLRSHVQYNDGLGLPTNVGETDSQGGQTFDDEVEKIKAVKIAQIKEQQGKQCPICYNTAILHRFNSNSADQKFAYRCCNSECNTDNLKTARAFNQHMVKHSESVQYEPASRVCPLCFRPRIEHKNRTLSDVEKGNHRGNLYKCCHCAASKLSAKKFFIHMENHVAKKHVCSVCGKGYSYKHLLNEHNWKEHGEGQHIRYPCNWEGCDYSAKYKQTLHTHVMERHHGVKRKHRQEDAYKKINCPTCNKSLKKWYYHQFHKKTCSSGNVIYQCEICGKEGFINAVTLQNHVRTKHSVDRPFNCEYCPAKYATAMSLSGHRSRKHGVNSRGEVVPKKMFPCDHCGKLLTSKMKLQAHIEVIHEGRRDYKCRFCDKTFTSKSNLQIHEGSLHTGVLPYRCEFCQKMFARRSQLATHKEAQHPGHAGPFYVVEDVDSVQVDDIIIPVESVEDGVEISVGVDSVSIMEGVAMA